MKENEKKRILLVDDDELFSQAVKNSLSDDFVIATLPTLENVEKGEFSDIDVFIVDIELPETSGFSVIEKIKKIHPDTPIILITGDANTERMIQVVRAGVMDFIEKPFDQLMLETTVRRVISHSELRKNLEKSRVEIEKIKTINAMVATYNHEIRNPLSIALSYADSKNKDPHAMEKIKIALRRIEIVVKEIEEVTTDMIPTKKYLDSTNMVQVVRRKKGSVHD